MTTGSEAEVSRLTERVSRLDQQLENERENHTSSTRALHAAAEEQRSKVSASTFRPLYLYSCLHTNYLNNPLTSLFCRV